ncbi:DUF402 domain-containing protein [Mycoplasmopsis pullorum]|uniref:Rnase g and e associated domain containing protein n=1 Tax=Mycoplasmopsis pullorum TaxID=48003 RepID=A0A1L4FRV9_9BACT|nr:DUF402 domain-containing protein [Mycoplasmopsis pullorum]APJ38357.1 rnase g and e associated domain containing protein [Mycoplasmopsis pullorum]
MIRKFPNLKVGKMITVQAYKYNGQLYRQWNKAKVLYNNQNHIVLILFKTKVTESSGKGWVYREPVIWFFSKKNMFNGLILLKKNGHYTYINLASTPIFEDETLKFVDYDLDVKCYPHKDLKIVDRDEFFTNSKKFKYPQSLKNAVYKNLSVLTEMYNNYQYFFNDKIIEYYLKKAIEDKIINFNFNEIKQKKQK